MAIQRFLTDEEKEQLKIRGRGIASDRFSELWLCTCAEGIFRKERDGVAAQVFAALEDGAHCDACCDSVCSNCGEPMPEQPKEVCCGVGEPVPGPNHELSCENHRALDLSVPTHIDEHGKSLCAGLINATELVKRGCPHCATAEVNYCPNCNKCVPCGSHNDGKSSCGDPNCCESESALRR